MAGRARPRFARDRHQGQGENMMMTPAGFAAHSLRGHEKLEMLKYVVYV